jgi:hypothetical protein
MSPRPLRSCRLRASSLAAAVALTCGLGDGPARAADDLIPPPPPPPSAARRALTVGAAIVPGFVLHGAGQAVAGHWPTALSLFGMELAGIGVGAAGALTFWFTGSSRQLAGPATALTLAGISAVAVSFLADVYGTLAKPGGTGAPEQVLPLLEASVGYRYVHDPRFAYRNLVGTSLDLRWRALRLSTSAWSALDAQNQRLRAVGAYRLLGPRPSRPEDAPAVDGTFLDVTLGMTHHAFKAEGFGLTLGEGFAMGRLDLARLGPSLSGSFAELGLGWALGAYNYAHGSSDPATQLLMRTAFGLYIGAPGRPHGEVSAYYDHRHDDYAAGLLMNGIVSGVFGHFGLEGICYMTDQWGLAAQVEIGSAAWTGLSLRYRVPAGGAR